MNPAKQQLHKLMVYNQIINARLEKRDKLMEAATRTTAMMKEDGASFGGGYGDRIGGKMAEIADLDKTIDFYIDVRYNLLWDTLSIIGQMHQRKHQDVLYKRYVEGKPFKLIQQEMGYKSYKGLKKLHERAVYIFGKIAGYY